MAPATNTTAANATVNASGASVSISDLYIGPPISDESRQPQRCERDKASPRLKLARFGKMRGRTRGGSMSVTIAQRHDPRARHTNEFDGRNYREFAADWILALGGCL